MQKIKTRSLLTIILAMLCAVAVAVGVSFALPKNTKSADAATNTPTISFGTEKFWWTTSTTGPNLSYKNDMSTTNDGPYNFGMTTGTNTISAISNYPGTAYITFDVIPVILTVKVPAYTIYTVDLKYSFTMSGRNGRAHGLSDKWSDDPNEDLTILYGPIGVKDLQAGLSGQTHGNPNTTTVSHGKHLTKNRVVFYNDSNAEKDMKAYSYYFHIMSDASPGAIDYTSGVTFDIANTTVTATKIAAPTTTDTTPVTYDGSQKTFNFKYDIPSVTVSPLGDSSPTQINIVPSSYSSPISYAKAPNAVETTIEVQDFENPGNTVIPAATYTGAQLTEPNNKYTLSSINSSGQVSLKATNAGKYILKFNLTADAKAGGVEWSGGGTAEQTFTFTINRKPVDVPTINDANTKTYDATTQKFSLTDFDKNIMDVDTTALSSDTAGASTTWNATNEEFEAKNAAKYTVTFTLTDDNHVWDDGSTGGTTDDQTADFTIKKKAISVSVTPAAESDREWDFGSAGTITVSADAVGIPAADQDFVLNIYYVKDGDTTKQTTGVTAATKSLDVSKVSASGDYKLYVGLTTAAANSNYTIGTTGTYDAAFKINAGAIDFSLLTWQYTTKDDGSGKQNIAGVDLRYKVDGSGLVKYYVSAFINDTTQYLEIDTTYNTGAYKNGFWTVNQGGSDVNYGDEIGTYKTRVALKTDSDHKFTDSTSYGILDGNDLTGWYEFSWEVKKGEIDQDYLDNLTKNLQYKTAAGDWQTYDPDNPPPFGSGMLEIRLDPDKYPDGLTGVTLSGATKKSDPGSYAVQVTFTVDTDLYETPAAKSFNWEIGAQAIEVDWTVEEWQIDGTTVLDANNVPYQIYVLNIEENLKQYVEYEYYLADPADPFDFSLATPVGKNNAGLNALKAAPNNASSTNPVAIFVKAVLKAGVKQYQLKDNTGATVPCTKGYELGASNVLVKVTQSATEMVYGESLFNDSLLTMIVDDGMNSKLDPGFIDSITVYDSDGNNLGLLSAFDGAKAKVGTYTIRIKLTAAGNDTYTLTPGSSFKFKVNAKKIALPTVDEIVFGNDFKNLADYLHGSYDEYKDIIRLGGTFDGVKYVGKNTATLTLTDPNYCWDYDSTINPGKKLAKYALADGSVNWEKDSDTVANLVWSVNPYVLKTSGWNLKGKDGAVYNIPADLTEGLNGDVQLWYYTDKASDHLGEGDTLKAGSTYFVKAELLGEYADNFVFEDSKTTTSDFVTYKLSKNGAAAALDTLKGFMLKTWLGIPVWAWLLIALALLILLIIIIAVACKRRKSKEERAEAKARKEEERERREEERRLQKEKLEAERELAKAKQEAELEKIRAQAQMAAGAGMASMAMQQQPQQQQMPQQMPQPVQQPMPQPQVQYIQSNDNSVLAEIKAELAEIKARQNMNSGYSQPAMPTAMQSSSQQSLSPYANDPVATAELIRLKAESEAHMRAELERARSEAERARLEAELARVRAENSRYMPLNQYDNNRMDSNSDMAKIGALAAAIWQTMNNGPAAIKAPELPQIAEESTNSSAMYPPDAVVTTTTTVDTTKDGKYDRTRRGKESDFMDVDGFYDSID